jgi:predicted dinucleotide-utilizing enzyme
MKISKIWHARMVASLFWRPVRIAWPRRGARRRRGHNPLGADDHPQTTQCAKRDAPHIIDNNISLDRLNGAIQVFEGSAREGAKAFPANVNVAAALGLAGIGADATQLEVWADPHLDRNTHSIEVDADSAKFTLQIENVQSESNPGTGKITALSVIACLRGMTAPMKVGS